MRNIALTKFSFHDLDNIIKSSGSFRKASQILNIPRTSLQDLYTRAKKKGFAEYKSLDREILEENHKLSHQKQKLQDINRIERKNWRGRARLSNALEEIDKELISLLKSKKTPIIGNNKKISPVKPNSDSIGIIQLSDLHLNECVSNSFGTYNWEIASKRLRKHFLSSMREFKANNINKVLIALTGDIFNSNRHLDEILLNATNRANALFLGFSLFRSAIIELIDNGFDVSVTFVAGNESRIEQECYSTNILANDNFDVMLFHMLRINLDDRVNFIIPDNVLESVVSVNDKNILLIHGNFGITKDIDNSISKFYSRYASIGVKLDYVLFGHIHNALISDLYARSSSMVGNNDYANFGLNLYGRPSQNFFIVSKDSITGVRNDLEDTDNIIGYEYDKTLEAYNSQSQSKLYPEKTIIKIVI